MKNIVIGHRGGSVMVWDQVFDLKDYKEGQKYKSSPFK